MTSVTLHAFGLGVSSNEMSTLGPSAGSGSAAAAKRDRKQAKPDAEKSESQAGEVKSRYSDVQSAARFPIKVPVAVKSEAGEQLAETSNISANGVLFQVDREMPVGSMVNFTISFPAEVIGSDNDVRVGCRGRVVRSFEEGGRRGVGVVIDEYRFER